MNFLPSLVNFSNMPIIRECVIPPLITMSILLEDPMCILPGEFPSKRLSAKSDFVHFLTTIRKQIQKEFKIVRSGQPMIRLCNSSFRDQHNLELVTRLAAELHGRELDVTNASWHMYGPRAFVIDVGKIGIFTTNHIVVAYFEKDLQLDDFNRIREIVNEVLCSMPHA